VPLDFVREFANYFGETDFFNAEQAQIDKPAIYSALSVSYLYKLTSTQQIPHFKPRGKIIYFDRSELDEWLRQNRVKTTAEIETLLRKAEIVLSQLLIDNIKLICHSMA
jgi:excisionase family DNA binding protein